MDCDVDSREDRSHLAGRMIVVHATCVAVDGVGVLLRGPSGSGKSDLALRLIDGGARLVADDRVALAVEDGRPVARAPASIAGLIEVRGLGVVRLAALDAAPVRLAVDLVPGGTVERMPDPSSCEIAGCRVPLVALDPFEASSAAKVRLALRLADRRAGTVAGTILDDAERRA